MFTFSVPGGDPGTAHPNTKKETVFFSCRGVEKKCNYRLCPVVTMTNPIRFRTSWCKVIFLDVFSYFSKSVRVKKFHTYHVFFETFFVNSMSECQNPLESKSPMYTLCFFRLNSFGTLCEFVLEFSLTNPSFGFAGEGCIAFWKSEKIMFC